MAKDAIYQGTREVRILVLIACVHLIPVLASAQPLPPPVDLAIQNIRQKTPVWCWAAVAQQIVLATRGPQKTPSQCALVAMANGVPPGECCSRYNPACVRTGSIPQIQWLIAQFGGRYSSYAPPTNPMTLYRTLSSGRAIILQLRTGQQSAHVVVVRGMSFLPTPNGVQPFLHVNDPMAIFTQPVPFAQIAPIWISAIVVSAKVVN